MKRNLLVVIAILVVMLTFTEVKAVDNSELAINLNGSKELNTKVDLTFHVSFGNLEMSSQPYGYLGTNFKFSKNFNTELMLGYGFERLEEKRGFIYVIDPWVKLGKFTLEGDYEYMEGLKCLYIYNDITYLLGPVKIGLDNRNFFYPESRESQAYQVGPSLRIPFSERATLIFIYFFSFPEEGERTNIFRVKLSLKF